MARSLYAPLRWAKRSEFRPRHRTRYPLEVGRLEGRALLSTAGEAVAPQMAAAMVGDHHGGDNFQHNQVIVELNNANPDVLWPPNHRFVEVTVSGRVIDESGRPPSFVSYNVIDSEGQVQPSGTARVHDNGTFSFQVSLQASRSGQDKSGRVYTIDVTATDREGNFGEASTDVVVPHDMGHSVNVGGSSSSNNNGGNGQGDNNGGNGQGDNNGGNGNGHGHGNGNGGNSDHGNGNSGKHGNGKHGD